jgi:hypothetical protein
MVARVQRGHHKEETGASNSQNLSHDATCFFPKVVQADEVDENYKTPVVVRLCRSTRLQSLLGRSICVVLFRT